MKRSPAPGRRRGLARRKPLKRGGPKRSRQEGADELTRAAQRLFRRVVLAAGRCAACGATPPHGEDGGPVWLDPHHVLEKQAIRAHVRSIRGGADLLRKLLWDPANGMCLCAVCHANHTLAAVRVPRAALTAAHWAFARALGEWAVVRLERDYPGS